MINALFSDLSEDSAEEICGGAKNPSALYGGTNYGQRKKLNPEAAELNGNPSVAYLPGFTNYGLFKQD